MNEIVIPKRFIILGLVLIGLVATAIWFAPQLYGSSPAQAGEAATPVSPSIDQSEAEDPAARDAALAGAKAAIGRRSSGKRNNIVQPGQLSIWSNLKEE